MTAPKNPTRAHKDLLKKYKDLNVKNKLAREVLYEVLDGHEWCEHPRREMPCGHEEMNQCRSPATLVLAGYPSAGRRPGGLLLTMITKIELDRAGKRVRLYHQTDGGQKAWTHGYNDQEKAECEVCGANSTEGKGVQAPPAP